MIIRLMNPRRTPWLALALMLAGLSGCTKLPDRAKTRQAEAEDYFAWKRTPPLLPEAPLTLQDAIAYALAHNLEMAISDRQERIRREAASGALRKMLPSLNFNMDRSKRDILDASTSETLFTHSVSSEPSFSEDKDKFTGNLALTWNIVDFGISYFRARQAKLETRISQEQARRARQNLALRVAEAYWLVQTKRAALRRGEMLLEKTLARQKEIADLVNKRQMPKSQGLEMQANLIETKIRIQRLRNDVQAGLSRLAALLGLPVGVAPQLADEGLDETAPADVPDFLALEEEALRSRPELYELDAKEQVAADNVRIALAEMFPNAAIFARKDRDANPFLYRHNWHTIGLNASMSLLSLPAKVARRAADKERQKLVDQQRLALAVGIVSQVRLATIDYENTVNEYRLLRDMNRTRENLIEEYRKKFEGDQAAGFEILGAETRAFFAYLRLMDAYAGLRTAETRLHNTVGREPLLYARRPAVEAQPSHAYVPGDALAAKTKAAAVRFEAWKPAAAPDAAASGDKRSVPASAQRALPGAVAPVGLAAPATTGDASAPSDTSARSLPRAIGPDEFDAGRERQAVPPASPVEASPAPVPPLTRDVRQQPLGMMSIACAVPHGLTLR